MASTSERLMFHLTDGALRRWTLWNEVQLPEYAVADEQRFNVFQEFKNFYLYNNPEVSGHHPMSMFDHWPYWLVIDLCRHIFDMPSEYEPYLSEPETLLEVIVDYCDQKFSDYEVGTPDQLFQ